VSRAGAIALLLLGSGLSPVVLASGPPADAAQPRAAVVPLAPDIRPVAPTDPTPPGESTGPTEPSGPSEEPENPDATDSPEPESTEGTPGLEDPLAVTITRLTPSTLQRRGEVTISGEITNVSDEEWTELTVYAATSATPVTTLEELEAAEGSPAGVEPPDYQRLVEPGLFARPADLGPGESTTYRLTIPRRRLELPQGPGVYRLGVQVLGTEPSGRADGADGRARVLIAAVPGDRRTRLAVAMQMRKRTVRTATGELDYVEGWDRTLGRLGRLRQVVRLLRSARRYPVALVVDPAVVEAAGSLAEGNTGLELTDTTVDGIDEVTGTLIEDPTSSPDDATPSDEGNGGGDDESDGSDADSEDGTGGADSAIAAVTWLQELRGALEGLDVMALPYGDLDVGAASRHGDEELIGRSLAAGISTLSAYGIQASGVLAPYNGLLGEEAAEQAPESVPLLVVQRTFGPAAVEDGTARLLPGDPETVPSVLTGPTTAPAWTYREIQTEPGTAAGFSALEMRQRILARAALQALNRPQEPLVVVLPPQWNPGTAWRRSAFFAGLRTSWLSPARLDALPPDPTPVVTTLPPEEGAASPSGSPAEDTSTALALRYPERQLGLEVPAPVFRAARQLTGTGAVLGDLVVDGGVLTGRSQRLALLGPSFHSRQWAGRMEGRIRASDNVLGSQLREVDLLAPRFVRMSSETGSFLVPVINRLDVPVRVQLRPEVTEPELTLEVPGPVVLEANTRQPIRVEVTASTIGVRSVRVDLVTASGERLYRGPTFSIRSSQVARWVWVAMAVGSAVLFVTIVIRIWRRLRARRSTHGPVLLRGGS
jgi:hypothetical protein